MTSYDASKSRATAEAMALFIGAAIEGPLTQVPGIGPVAAQKLMEAHVGTMFQLIGQFLLFKDKVSTCSCFACIRLFVYLPLFFYRTRRGKPYATTCTST